MKLSKSKRLNHYIKLACLTGALFCYSASAYAEVMPNTQLPVNGQWIMGGPNSNIINPNDTVKFDNNTMNIKQEEINAVIKWGKFSIGSIATVNFDTANRDGNGQFNILNYDAGGSMSQIRGTLKTTEGGNVYIVNPAGVFIGNSAQVDVGSLYVSNKKLKDDALGNFNGTAASINDMIASDQPATPAELMSLGHINATNVTFDGNRIVLDTELLTTGGLENKMEADKILIKTNSKDNVVIGYDAYNVGGDKKTYNGKNDSTVIAKIKVGTNNEENLTKSDGYMWVRDLEQLQDINTNKSGNYALRNGIGAISTKTGNFTPIGTEGDAFKGKFDGLAGNVDGIDFAIFDLHVTGAENQNNLGLFGVTEGAEIRNVLLTGGEVTGTGDNIGALVGLANNTTIENVRNSINVIGGTKDDATGKITSSKSENIGGIVGKVEDAAGKGTTKISDILNAGDISGFANVGGVVGSIAGNTGTHAVISGAENIGRVQGVDKETISDPDKDYSHDIGGIAGKASNTDISNVENNLQIVGGYNVGGIVGSGEGVSIKGAVNNADVTANGYTTEAYKYHSNNYDTNGNWKETYQSGNNIIKIPETSTPNVNIANIGGIIGSAVKSSIGDKFGNSNVINYGNVKSIKTGANDSDPYNAGNVGGIAGRAEDTNIYNVENKENEIYGAHNVGGIAGYLENGTITLSSNNGSEIMATGARYENKFVYERVRPAGVYSNEPFIIGNMGGIAGYMYGDASYISQSGNRGNVHSQIIKDQSNILDSSKAANVGGIVGKIDRSNTKSKTDLIDDKGNIKTGVQAAIYDCYNRGDIQGYTGVGGVVGMMYNGEVVTTDNSGTVTSTRISTGSVDPLNMGGIVGDTTEDTDAHAFIYDVHNDGVIGSSDFSFYGRHVGGVVGRLNGDVEKAYNTGAIYNAYSNTGGIVGYSKGNGNKLTNVFNTGNITVYNVDTDQSSAVGGIVGGERENLTINNAYNLGTLRSFRNKINESIKDNTIGGIIGNSIGTTNISNVYTLGNLYAYDGGSTLSGLGAIYGSGSVTVSNAYYIKPDTNLKDDGGNVIFKDLSNSNSVTPDNAKAIDFDNRTDWSQYKQVDEKGNPLQLGFSDASLVKDKTNFGSNGDWRIYNYQFNDGTTDTNIATTPILNAFMPKSQGYFGSNYDSGKLHIYNIDSIQYGTAYNPLLTIINAQKPASTEGLLNGLNTISFKWNDINPDRSASFAVFNGNLKIDKFDTKGNLYGGTLYAKGDLSINNVKAENNSGDILLGSGAKLYGSTINITSGTVENGTTTLTNGGKLVNYGTIRSTGQVAGGSGITLRAEGDVEIIGEVTSNGETNVVVTNVGRYPTDPKEKDDDTNGKLAKQIIDNIANMNKAMPSVGDYYSRSFTSDTESRTGDITITSQKGDVSVLLGVAEKGVINTSKDLTITGQNVYVDSDLSIKGSLDLNATDKTVLDITNIGAVNTNAEGQEKAREAFVTHFKTTTTGDTNNNTISFSNPANAMITMDLWNGNNFNLASHLELGYALRGMKVDGVDNGFDLFHIWVDDAAALQGINNATDNNILTYNFALKNDIDVAELGGKFTAIGADTDTDDKVDKTQQFTGKFNGRGNTIVGMNVDNKSAGLFSVIGDNGEVSNLNIYSSHFTGGTVGAVAGINKGTIDNVMTFGNRVNSNSTVNADAIAGIPDGHHGGLSSAGGITGINNGTISNAATNDAVATSKKDEGTKHSFAGGIAGVNTAVLGRDAAKIDNSVANSDITSTEGAHALGGIVGSNSGNAVLDTVRSLGIVNGTYSVGNNNVISDNIGGIAGINEGGAQITKAYNVAHVSGGSNVGGIVGKLVGSNTNTTADKYDLQEVVSAGDVTSQGTDAQNVGGIVGSIQNEAGKYTYINSGRNTGEVTGVNNVGGLVGNNGETSQMTNIINDANATIKGDNNVGGLAGTNAGAIVASDMGLVNDGRVYGVTNVGGIAGVNTGKIENTNSNITLYVNNEKLQDKSAQYFGGVAGRNEGTITSATNTGSVLAKGASYVGGITGANTENGHITGAGNSNSGKVVGAKFVGGVAGLNVGSVSGTDSGSGATTIENKGIVIATNNGAGGIFGENRANISDTILKNSGIVVGTTPDGTGGIIGLNSGDITKSDLINTVDGLVVGVDNVGGLIGINKGTIAGGRDASDSYYAHQVYNNGTVIGGNGTDTKPTDTTVWTSKTITDDKGNPSTIWYQVDTNSHDIGGLIGSNGFQNAGGTIETGSLTAGYNTGVVNGGTNVGGVVGNNVNGSTVDQVFNAGTVTGTTFGTVIGYNDGTVKNAYDVDHDVSETVGNGNTVGSGNNNVTIENNTKGKPNIWTTYGDDTTDYGTDKLLSVFLTKLNFVPAEGQENAFNEFVYNANKQQIIVKAVENGTDADGNKLYLVNVYKNDGLGNTNSETLLGNFVNASGDEKAAHSLADLINTKVNKDGTIEGEGTGDLLSGTSFTDAGTYNIFNTKQIDVNGQLDEKNPNNLGFDVTEIKTDNNTPIDKVTVNKAQISLTLDQIWRIYGNKNITSNEEANVADSNHEKHYALSEGSKYGYVIKIGNQTLNQDMLDDLFGTETKSAALKVSYNKDEAVDGLDEGKTTNNVGKHNWSLEAKLSSDNYKLVDSTNGIYTGVGKSHVTPATLQIKVDDKTMQLGGTVPVYTGSITGNTNGDELTDIFGESYKSEYQLGDTTLTGKTGEHKNAIGIVINGTYYKLESSFADFSKNYAYDYQLGTLTVTANDPTDPTNPDNPYSPDNPNNWQAEDKYPWYQWDKQRNERERKAEVHFVDGGMHVEA